MASQFSSFATPEISPYSDAASIQQSAQISFDQAKIDAAATLNFEPTKLDTKTAAVQSKLDAKVKAAGVPVDTDTVGGFGEGIDAAQASLAKFGAGAINFLGTTGIEGTDLAFDLEPETKKELYDKLKNSEYFGSGISITDALDENNTELDSYFGVQEASRTEQAQVYKAAEALQVQADNIDVKDASSLGSWLGVKFDQVATNAKVLPLMLGDSTGESAALFSKKFGLPLAIGSRVTQQAGKYKENNNEGMNAEQILIATVLNGVSLGGEAVLLKTGLGNAVKALTGKSKALDKIAGFLGTVGGEYTQERFDYTVEQYTTQKKGSMSFADIWYSPKARAAGTAGATAGGALAGGAQTVAIAPKVAKTTLKTALTPVVKPLNKFAKNRQETKEKKAASSFSDAGYATAEDKTAHKTRTEQDITKIKDDIDYVKAQQEVTGEDYSANLTQLDKELKLTEYALEQIDAKPVSNNVDTDYDSLSTLDDKDLTTTLSELDNATLATVIADAKVARKTARVEDKAAESTRSTLDKVVVGVQNIFNKMPSQKVIDEAIRIKQQRKVAKEVYDPTKPIAERAQTFVTEKAEALQAAVDNLINTGKNVDVKKQFRDTAKTIIQLVENSDNLSQIKNTKIVKDTIDNLQNVGTITKARADSLHKKLAKAVQEGQTKAEGILDTARTTLNDLNKKLKAEPVNIENSDGTFEQNPIRETIKEQITKAQEVYNNARQSYNNIVKENEEYSKELDEKTAQRNKDRDPDKPLPNVVTDTVEAVKKAANSDTVSNITKDSKELYDKMVDKIKDTNVKDAFKKAVDTLEDLDYQGMYQTIIDIGNSEKVKHAVNVVSTLVDSKGKPLINDNKEGC